ncbi:Putative sensor [Marinactinospora thermotolerans DSM 45154]|uniref:Putative sensor n=2 Tax=Marinactinospora thermotolerans TaxID=531310 RepID=A0A1T4PNW9_9ACTN|nr:Putative sensor [Marinactinospora thermotolerans DSM 45154]
MGAPPPVLIPGVVPFHVPFRNFDSMTDLLRRLGTDTRCVLLGFPLSLVSFVLSVTGLALGVGTAVTVVGVPILALTLLMARGFATAERSLMTDILGRRFPPPRYRRAAPGAGTWRVMTAPLACAQSWMDLLHAVTRLPLAVLTFSVVVSWWAVTLHGLAFPFYRWSLVGIPGYQDLSELIGLGSGATTSLLFHLALSAAFALTLPFVTRACALLNAGLGMALLSPQPVADVAGPRATV